MRPRVLALVLLAVLPMSGQRQHDRQSLGQFRSGGSFDFMLASGRWGIEIGGAGRTRLRQPHPATIELYRSESDIRTLAAAYDTVRRNAAGVLAQADIDSGGGVRFL